MKQFLIAIAAFAFITRTLSAWCPLCGGATGQTLAGEYNAADLIVVGTLKNAKQNLDDLNKSTTELHITSVIKDHPYLAGKKMVILPRYYPPESLEAGGSVLIFAGVYPPSADTAFGALYGGAAFTNFDRYTFDPYRGDAMTAKGELAKYLKGATDRREKPVPERLKFYFDYLDTQDLAIGSDAFLEFATADYKDVREAAKTLPADKIAGWLVDPNTPPSRFGLYGLLIGHSGRKQDAVTLRKLLDEPKKHYTGGIDGLLGGYILLEPAAGWDFLVSIIKDPNAKFDQRYAALRTLRFFWEYRPDVIEKAKLLDAMKLLMKQIDIADMPIEDLRKWNCHDLTADVIALGHSSTHVNDSFVRRSILKYLLTVAPKDEKAAAFISEMRKNHAEWVKAAEETLEFEKQLATPKK